MDSHLIQVVLLRPEDSAWHFSLKKWEEGIGYWFLPFYFVNYKIPVITLPMWLVGPYWGLIMGLVWRMPRARKVVKGFEILDAAEGKGNM